MKIFIIYDIVSNKVRKKIADTCLDYGLQRIQYSTFEGELSSNRRQEIALKLEKRLGKSEGSVLVIGLCEKCDERIVEMGHPITEE
ncbi:MAG: CRISPR-associated endonuclease Cas2 [Fimbriimonadia bacterium]|nr:CRISPR-associated endonuclease Cas2 [Fimbriimonadia bacterium]